ncbi:hypothetical protein [Oceanobacillus senegalensis]|uniref:hypothetical protein n=1 Tax=Oceanobacillus senegalensis TaxID=1936063 RepID=UPI000A304985|nr:hypothetical protein [Oceanobacillus senegalensis]
MNQYTGAIFSGELDKKNETFYLTEVKSLTTGSTLSLNQLEQMYSYLGKQQDSCMLTVNDQIPVLIQENEKNELINDLHHILKNLNHVSSEGSSSNA